MASIAEDPAAQECLGHLYVIQIARGRIKVGMTTDPITRLATHRGTAIAHGCLPGPEWLSPRGTGTEANENALIRYNVAQASARFRSEYFTGVPFLAAVREGVRICGDSEAVKILSRPRAAQTLTELAERRKRDRTLPPAMLAAAQERAAEARRLNPWIGRPGRCTEAEAAEWLGVSVDQVVGLVRSGVILRVPARGARRLYLRTTDVEQVALRDAG